MVKMVNVIYILPHTQNNNHEKNISFHLNSALGLFLAEIAPFCLFLSQPQFQKYNSGITRSLNLNSGGIPQGQFSNFLSWKCFFMLFP